MPRRLVEAINVQDAVHIGTANGYDVFDILSFSAAEQFRVENRDDRAGSAYVQNEGTFNSNINNSQHLYFFAEENTNKVYGAIVKSTNTHASVTFVGENAEIDIVCNFMFENAGENSSKTYSNKPLPFFLIPGARFNGQCPEIDCLYIEDGVLSAALVQFADVPRGELLALDNMPAQIESISSTAFNFGVEVDIIKLDDRIESLPAHCMDKVHNRILVTSIEAPDSWNPQWNAGKESITIYGYGMDPEEAARLEQERMAEREAAAEAERQRQAEAQRRAEEEARQKAEREARKIRYRVIGKEVKIIGTIPGVTTIEIPSEIEGKPVTIIGAYAFFGNQDLRSIKLPRTIEKIEAGAFAETEISGPIYIPDSCKLLGKNVKFGSQAMIVRSSDLQRFT